MIDSSWSLFLDRDGVINRRIVDGYVKSWTEFEFLPGVPEALKILSERFDHIVVVSNQQGVGKGMMSRDDVTAVHENMIKEITSYGGRIDRVYFCPDLKESGSFFRKPGVGMALQARKDLPGIRFRKSFMVGDSLSDMIFGARLGMHTVFIGDDRHTIRKGASIINESFESLISFSTQFVQSSSLSPHSPH